MWLGTCPVVTSLISQGFCHKNRPFWLMSVKNPVVRKTVAGLSRVLPYSHDWTDRLLSDCSLLFTSHQLGDLQTTRQFGLSVCVSTVACNNWYEALSCSHHVSDNPWWVCICRSVRFSNISHSSEVQYFHHCYPDTTVWNANVLLPWNTSGGLRWSLFTTGSYTVIGGHFHTWGGGGCMWMYKIWCGGNCCFFPFVSL